MTCTHLGEASGQPCGLPATLLFGYPMCVKHKNELMRWVYLKQSRQVAYLSRRQELPPSKGHTYCLLLAGGKIKIGYTGGLISDGEIDKIKARIRASCNKGNVVDILALFDEGWTLEQRMHYDLDEWRLMDEGEVFSICPEVLSAVSLGSGHSALPELRDYIASYNLKLQS